VQIRNEVLHSFFERSKLRVTRCLAPGMNCKNTAIRSHSLQNSRVLDQLVRDGHVKALTKKISSDSGPVIAFEDVGRNDATTFGGFCAMHDSAIFKAIEVDIFRRENPEHLFLISYRALARELNVLMEAAFRIQASYQDRVKLGIDSGDVPTPVGMLAVEYMTKSYSTYEYKCAFDEVMATKQYTKILHDVIQVNHERPHIAVCSLFSIDGLSRGDGDYVRIALNLLPQNTNQSAVIFGYLPQDQELVRPFLNPILTAEEHYQKYLLSKLILNNCENFVVSPVSFDRWSPEKRKAITDYFVKTLLHGDFEAENQHFYLF
jgi:hypothetical protein